MAEIITEEEAKLSLRLGDTLDDTDQADLTLAIAQAEGIYFTYNPESQWDDTSPATDTDSHKAAVLLLLHAIWDNRGEDPLPKAYDLMRLNRGPALA
jgi:hypothetical protein